jgi:O-antigen/teichoic acid export membrane protein
MFLISIVIFRTVDKSHYGLYVVIVSLFAVIDLLLAGLNDSIVRFLNDKISLNEKQNIVLLILCYRYFLIFMFVAVIYIARQSGFFEFLIDNYSEVSDILDSFLIVAILNGVIGTIIGINTSVLNSQKYYKLNANLGLIRNVIYLLIVLLLSFYSEDYLDYLHSSILLSLILLLYLSIKIHKECYAFSLGNLIRTKLNLSVVKQYIFPYSVPLTLSSLLTYVKNHLPILILGKEFSLGEVAVFSILKTLFKSMHSVSGSFIDPMMAKFLELKNNTKTFTKKINAIFYGTFALRFFSLLAFIVLMKYFFIIYKIENNEINQFIFYVLGIEYVVAGMILSYGVILKLEKSTIKILIASIVRFAIEVLLIYFLLIEYGIMAAAVILLVARYTETVTTYLLIIRQGILNWTGFLLVIWALPVLYFLSKLLFAAS